MKGTCFFACAVLAAWSPALVAGAYFEEISSQAGVSYRGPTAGASWGDVDDDGWPDIWIGNHRFDADNPNKPVLLVNNRDGTFTNRVDQVVSIDPEADLHGSAWADFDNDGDQDLFIIAGGGGGDGSNANLLLINQNGRLVNHARDAGVDYPLGRGRTPAWVDANLDGTLDLVLMNTPRPDGKAPAALFLNRGARFEGVTGRGALRIAPWGGADFAKAVWYNLARLRFSKTPSTISAEYPFAELVDIEGNGRVDILAFANPSRVFETGSEGLRDITLSSGLVSVPKGVSDAVIADFDGDLQYDIYIARALSEANTVSQVDEWQLRATVRGPRGDGYSEISFATEGDIEVQFAPGWGLPYPKPPEIQVGSDFLSREPGRFSLALKRGEAVWNGASGGDRRPDLRIYNTGARWVIQNGFKRLGLEVLSSLPISDVSSKNVQEREPAQKDYLLFRDGDTYRAATDFAAQVFERPCHSVAAGDFDNDMDVDIYLVCTTPTENAPNILLENDGVGRFRDVSAEAGVQGTDRGRGDTVIVADYDRDGFLDLFVNNGFGPPPFTDDGPYELFHNKGNTNHWIEIDLEGVNTNRDGIGTQVIVDAGGRRQIRMQNGGTHSFAQDHKRLHFGLGDHETIASIRVTWPSGTVQELKEVSVDRILTIREARPGSS